MTPLSLDSTAPLRGERPKRRWTLVVMGHGRWRYFHRAMDALASVTGWPFDRVVFCLDGVDWKANPAAYNHLFPRGELLTTGPERKGLTANMAQALGVLTEDDEYVAWVEEDFVVSDFPLDEMADTLDAFGNVANMVLLRQPWNAAEQRAGSVLPTIPGGLTDRGGWLEHTAGFWLNPFVAHASLLRSLQPWVEDSLTRQCRARGLTFGYWGGMHDAPRCEHIGVEGGMGSQGWLP